LRWGGNAPSLHDGGGLGKNIIYQEEKEKKRKESWTREKKNTRKLESRLAGIFSNASRGDLPHPDIAVITGSRNHVRVKGIESEIQDLAGVDKGGNLGRLPAHVLDWDDSNLASGFVQGDSQELGAHLAAGRGERSDYLAIKKSRDK